MALQSPAVQEKRRLVLQQYPIDGPAVKKLTEAGLTWLEANRQTVNALNVFPVPDGDTGTNMVLTMKAAQEEIANLGESKAGKMLDAVARGALMGARGNSGVILSQLWRGFARSVDGKDALDGPALAAAFASARDTAYKGVVRPVEGTILTVAKDIAEAAEKAARQGANPNELLQAVVEEAESSVERTPDLLPILKEAGVVDSGGMGLYYLLEGMARWINGQQLHTPESSAQPLAAMNLEGAMEQVEEGQDYEVVVDFRPNEELDLEEFYGKLEEMGTSIQVGEGEGMYRMHIHVPTEKRYEPIDYTMTLGTVTNVAIENLIAQMDELGAGDTKNTYKLTSVDPGEIAVVAVVPGPGIAQHFAELGVAALVEGGQTMNPSTADILAAFENLPTNQVLILPNNKNIVMAAEAAADLTVKEVEVVASISVPQGLSAMLKLAPGGELGAVAGQMRVALGEVQTGEITTATRDVEIDGVQVKEGQIIGLHNGKLAVSSADLKDACLKLLEEIGLNEYELVTFFYGSRLAKDQANAFVDEIRAIYPDHEIELHEGGQPHYQFILSAE